jgi:hypothetical protein
MNEKQTSLRSQPPISAKNIKFDRAHVNAWLEPKKVSPKQIKERDNK